MFLRTRSRVSSSISTSNRGRKSLRTRLGVESLEGRALLTLTPIDFGATITSPPGGDGRRPVLQRHRRGPRRRALEERRDEPPAPSCSRTSARALTKSSPRSLTVVGNTVFFSANDGHHGFELWKTDGTAAGTVMVKDVYPGPSAPTPRTW